MDYSLDVCIQFYNWAIKNNFRCEIRVASHYEDDGYSYCPSFPKIDFIYYLPIIGWQSIGSFYPRLIFESKYFEMIWNILPEIEENVYTHGKHSAFDELIAAKNANDLKLKKFSDLAKAKKILETKFSLLTEEENEVINKVLNQYSN